MTVNFLAFKRYVEKKFGSMAKFSFLMTGTTYGKFKRLENLPDTEANYNRIWKLHDAAKKLKNDPGKTTVSDENRNAIISKMKEIVEKNQGPSKGTTYKKIDWLNANSISQTYFSSVTKGRYTNKNLAYERLVEKLGLSI